MLLVKQGLIAAVAFRAGVVDTGLESQFQEKDA